MSGIGAGFPEVFQPTLASVLQHQHLVLRLKKETKRFAASGRNMVCRAETEESSAMLECPANRIESSSIRRLSESCGVSAAPARI